ncbi:hypothetical protein CCR75_008261 [Bremia lactucae]|uniref:Uncharacterized protein n=1 Tax=Bremia lactucae TaxID=4779 RepID=A0A976IL79_BRELC|nr:hypothetical protein CCR75_008261 [Bremia lactucae]
MEEQEANTYFSPFYNLLALTCTSSIPANMLPCKKNVFFCATVATTIFGIAEAASRNLNYHRNLQLGVDNPEGHVLDSDKHIYYYKKRLVINNGIVSDPSFELENFDSQLAAKDQFSFAGTNADGVQGSTRNVESIKGTADEIVNGFGNLQNSEMPLNSDAGANADLGQSADFQLTAIHHHHSAGASADDFRGLGQNFEAVEDAANTAANAIGNLQNSEMPLNSDAGANADLGQSADFQLNAIHHHHSAGASADDFRGIGRDIDSVLVGNHGGNLQSADMPLHSDAGANAGLELASRVHHDGVEFPRIASEQLNVLHNQQVHDPTVQVTASSKTDPLSTRRLR